MPTREQAIRHTDTFVYNGQPIPFRFWTSPGSQNIIHTIIFLGTGQVGRIPKWVASLAPPHTAVIEGMPHWKAHPSGNNLKDFSKSYTANALQNILTRYHVRNLSVIGISQAAPGVVWAVNSLPDVSIRSIGLVTPLGFTKHVFGPSDETRIRELKKRAAKSLLQRNQSPFASLRNLYVFLIITRARFLEPENGASDRKYAEGLSHDITGECMQIMAKRPDLHFSVVLGERDTLFPPSEVLDSLKDARLGAIKVSVIPGMTHASFASNHHKELLQKIIAIIHA